MNNTVVFETTFFSMLLTYIINKFDLINSDSSNIKL